MFLLFYILFSATKNQETQRIMTEMRCQLDQVAELQGRAKQLEQAEKDVAYYRDKYEKTRKKKGKDSGTNHLSENNHQKHRKSFFF